MSNILTVISVSDGKIKRSSLEVLSRCRELAEQHNLPSCALIMAENSNQIADQLQNFGLDTIYTIEHQIFRNHLNTPVIRALSAAVDKINPRLVAFASTESSKDILGAIAANKQAAALSDMSEFELTESGVKGKRPVMASKIISTVEASGTPVFISVRAGSYEVVEIEGSTSVETIPFSFESDELRATLKEIIRSTTDRIDLAEADVVIAAGRGVKDEEGRHLIEELATVLRAGIGASRALTEAGHYDPALQIGQTGKVVSPQLYIGVGISGAIQHVAGMANSKVIVAINRDPDAPIFDIADYGLVGDLYKILPPFIDELKKIKAEN